MWGIMVVVVGDVDVKIEANTFFFLITFFLRSIFGSFPVKCYAVSGASTMTSFVRNSG